MRTYGRTMCCFAVLALAFTLVGTPVWAGSGEKVKEEVCEAFKAIKDYSIDKKDAVVQKTKEMVKTLDNRIEKLRDRLDENWDKMDAEAREKARANLKILRKQRNDLAEWAGGIAHGSKNAWEEVKTGFSNAYDNLGNALKKAEKEF